MFLWNRICVTPLFLWPEACDVCREWERYFGQEPNPESLGTVRYIMVKDVAKASWQAGAIFTTFGSSSSFSHSSIVSPILSSLLQPQNFQRYVSTDFTFMWPWIVTHFFLIEPTKRTNFQNFILPKISLCFGHFLCPS